MMINKAKAAQPSVVDRVAGAIADAQREIGRQAESWTQSAGDAGRDVSRDAMKASQEVTRRAGEQLAGAIEPILEQLRTAARDASANARDQAEELRSLRLTTEPPRGPRFLGWLALGLAAAVGALIMFLMDPDRGPRRRALVRGQVVHWTAVAQDKAAGQAEHAADVSHGMAHEAGKATPTGKTTPTPKAGGPAAPADQSTTPREPVAATLP